MFKKRKKMIMSTRNNEDYIGLCKRIEKEGIEIDMVSYNTEHDRYDIFMNVTRFEAYALLDLTTKYNAVLWKGES